MSIRGLVLAFHGWKTRRKMERVFGRGEDPYGYFSLPHEVAKQELIASLLADRSYGEALEVGCAEGAFTRRMAAFCRRVEALDISPTAVKRLRERLKDVPQVVVTCADAYRFTPARPLDLIVASEVLYYLGKDLVREEFRAFLSRIPDWLKPGGRLLVAHSFANEAELAVRKGYVEDLLKDARLSLVKETTGGTDPRKSKYLISLLERKPA